MKRLLLTVCLAALGVSAGNAITVKAGEKINPLEKGGTVRTTKSYGKAASRALDLRKARAAGTNDFGAITESPAGEVTMMMGTSQSFYLDYGEINMDEAFGVAYEGVFTDDGEFYLKNPIVMLDAGVYIKGTVTEEGIEMTFPQPFMQIDEEGEEPMDIYFDLLEWTEVVNPWDPEDIEEGFFPAEERSVLFVKNEDGSYTMEGDYMIGVTYDDLWQYYGEMYMTLEPFSATPVEVPEGLDWDYSYILADELNGWGHTILRPLGIAYDGDDVYMKGLNPNFNPSAIKGKFDRENNTLTVETDQLMGDFFNHYIFMMTGKGYEYYDDFWECNVIAFAIMEEPVVLNYDPETNVFTPVIPEGYDYVYFIYNFGNTQTYPCDYYAIDRIYSQGKITDYAPIAPEIIALEDISYIDPDYSYSFEFDIFGDNAEGQMLRDESIYYNLFINGEPYKLTAEDYPELADEGYTELTDIPVFLNVGNDIFAEGTFHGIALKAMEIETVGVRAVCIEGNNRGESPIVTIDKDGNIIEGGVGGVMDASVVRTEWYDLGGRRVSGPEGGVSIRRDVYGDGRVKTTKMF